MRPFTYTRAADASDAFRNAQAKQTHYLAGGTTLIDLMKLDVVRPDALVDINPLRSSLSKIELSGDRLKIGALANMANVAADENIRKSFPVIAQSLELAASPQIRNMATLGGNVLQRTRCTYFRDVSYPCNKRAPGSGCSALHGVTRTHAVLGASEHCIATYPGDFAQALIALDAQVELQGRAGTRIIPFKDLHRQPGDQPQIETSLQPGELVTGFVIEGGPFKRSKYLKIRDRESYEFALSSVAVALTLDGEVAKDIRIALGGVATVPWRASEAEKMLQGKPLSDAGIVEAATAAFAGARTTPDNEFKVRLGRQAIVRALREVRVMEV